MKKILRTLAVVAIAGMFLLSACSSHNTSRNSGKENGKLYAVSTFSILTDIVAEIGGDQVEVHNIVPIGNDPHEYESKPEDTKKTADADLFFYNGMNLEGGDAGWVHKLLHSTGKKDGEVFEATDGVEPKYLGDEEGNEGSVNPHAFLDPNVGMKMAKNIRDAFIKVDPDHKTDYKENAEAYLEKLKDIDQEYQDKIADIPKADRVFVTSERAYQYMTECYGLKSGFIWEIDTEEIGTPDQIKSAVQFVDKNDPPALFVESNVDQRPMKTVAKESGVEIADTLYSDELGKEGTAGATYLGFLKSNIKKIHDGLAP